MNKNPKEMSLMEFKDFVNAFCEANRNKRSHDARPVMERLESIRDCVEECGDDYDVVFAPEVFKLLTKQEWALREWTYIAAALNEGWEPDFNNSNEQKWRPYYIGSGAALSLHDVHYNGSSANVGARQYFKNKQLLEFALNKWPETFNNFFNY